MGVIGAAFTAVCVSGRLFYRAVLAVTGEASAFGRKRGKKKRWGKRKKRKKVFKKR
jgi:hypothetical protein